MTDEEENEICEILINNGKEMAIYYLLLNGFSENEAEELVEAYIKDGLC